MRGTCFYAPASLRRRSGGLQTGALNFIVIPSCLCEGPAFTLQRHSPPRAAVFRLARRILLSSRAAFARDLLLALGLSAPMQIASPSQSFPFPAPNSRKHASHKQSANRSRISANRPASTRTPPHQHPAACLQENATPHRPHRFSTSPASISAIIPPRRSQGFHSYSPPP